MKMSEHMTIRKGELRDANTLAQFNIKMAKETENKELDFETVLRGVKAIIKDAHKGFYLVAERKGQIVGQLMVTPEWSDWRNMNFYWIQSVYVPEESRKQGIFAALFHHLKDIVRYKKNVAGLRLYVEVNNEGAKQVYEALGMHNPGYNMYELLL
jgi:ribosomal protein S18 acetylase RimI-like enzyme